MLTSRNVGEGSADNLRSRAFALAFLVCAESGSLSISGFNQEKAFARILYDNFDEKTARIAIYAFSYSPRIIVPFNSSFEEGRDILNSTETFLGGTDILEAVTECGSALQPFDNGRQKLIILMTDGQGGSESSLINASATFKAQDVTISTVGVSQSGLPSQFDEELLRNMSSKKKNGDDLFYGKVLLRCFLLIHLPLQV